MAEENKEILIEDNIYNLPLSIWGDEKEIFFDIFTAASIGNLASVQQIIQQ